MQTDQNSTEIELVHSAKRGVISAFEELVRRYTKRVFCIAYHITRCHDDAEEVTQETFLKAFVHLEDFAEQAQFSTWLTRIAFNAALTNVRSRRVRVVVQEDPKGETGWPLEEVADWRANPEQLYSRSELRALLRQALQELPQLYSTVFILRDIQGLSVAETAAVLGVTIPAVKTRLLRARLQLRESLSKSFAPTWSQAGHAPSNLISGVRPLSTVTMPRNSVEQKS
ncbi:MAG: RNA polymerase subunit sigma-24 [Acidobacteria bacterium]|nr:MAG: RNA polymerase subunit sigma-24 [Acidobacteriota bacterium]